MAERGMYPPREFDCETVVTFGKHVNKTCREIYDGGDSGYLEWMMTNFHNDTFTNRFVDMLNGQVVEVEDDEDFDIPF